jgi:hypothetical protein
LTRPAFGVVVAEDADPLAEAIASALIERGVETRLVLASQLALEAIAFDASTATLGGRVVDAAVFLAEPTASFGGDFTHEDAEFCNAEVRAAWLGLLNLPSVATVTRWTAEEWGSFGEWAIWRRRLLSEGIACSPIAFGTGPLDEHARWVPFSSAGTHPVPGPLGRRVLALPVTSAKPATTSIWCCGRVVAGSESALIDRCGDVLESYGTRLASIVLDRDGAVFACTSRVDIRGERTIALVAQAVAGQLHVDLARRRS